MDTWRNKAVIVAGASSGIGEAVAKNLVAQGAKVVAMARRLERLQAIPGARPLAVDLTEPEQVANAIERATNYFGENKSIAGLFHFVAMGYVHWPGQANEPAKVQELIETNVESARLLYQAVQPHLDPTARLAFCSSAITLVPDWLPLPVAAYREAKRQLEAYIKELRSGLKRAGLNEQSVTVILPGLVNTEIWKKGTAGRLPVANIIGGLGSSAEQCAHQISADVLARKPASYPTPEVARVREIRARLRRRP